MHGLLKESPWTFTELNDLFEASIGQSPEERLQEAGLWDLVACSWSGCLFNHHLPAEISLLSARWPVPSVSGVISPITRPLSRWQVRPLLLLGVGGKLKTRPQSAEYLFLRVFFCLFVCFFVFKVRNPLRIWGKLQELSSWKKGKYIHIYVYIYIYTHTYILQFQGFTGPLKPGYRLLSKNNSKDFLNLRSYEYLYSWLIITLKSCIPPLEEYACLSPSGLLWQNTIDWVAHKQQKPISHSSGGWKSEIRVLVWSGSDESPPLGWRQLSSLCALTQQEEDWRALWVSVIRALILFLRAPPSWPTHLPKAPPTNFITWGARFQHMTLGIPNTQPIHSQENSTSSWKNCPELIMDGILWKEWC